jgi:Dyp-type peroxidase family
MSIIMSEPLSWKNAHNAAGPNSAVELTMLNDLQGNILKGHGRRFTSNLFLKFDPTKAQEAKSFLAALELTTALEQLLAAERYKEGGPGGGDFYSLLISACGYDALGEEASKPDGVAFNAGMKDRPGLSDPEVQYWDSHFRGEVHAMILIASERDDLRNAARDQIINAITATAGAVILLNNNLEEDGNALFNNDNNGIEHFGYVDGRSQPLALVEQLQEEKKNNGGTTHWDPKIPLSQLLTKCPGGKWDVSHGSYFVFRKLDQNVRAFKARETAIENDFKKRFDLSDEEIHERLGATVVGRFENGTPVTVFGSEQSPIAEGPIGVPNDFNYSSDPLGMRCPFAGHIRKTNPRTDTPDSKRHLMARRGIPYGRRDDVVNNVLPEKPEHPTKDVGLLFMAYQSSLEDQFEFTQQSWANNVGFARPLALSGSDTGIDPLIGQPSGPSGQRWPAIYGISESDAQPGDDFSGFVTMRGGEYFFAPSISFVKALS